MSKDEIDILEEALIRERAANKHTEKLLEEKTIQLRAVYENISDAYIVMDLKGDVLKMNTPAIALFGYNINKEKLNVTNLIYKEDYDYAMQSFKELYKKGVFTNYKARIITKKGEVRWVHINSSVLFGKGNKPLAAQGIIRDITEAKSTAEIIESQKKQLDIIVENSSLGIALTHLGTFLKTNKTFQDFLGYSEKELLKLTIKDVSFEEDYSQSKENLIKMDTGEIDNFVIEKRYKRKGGSVVWAKTNVNAVREENGTIKYQVALIEDITNEREKTLIIDMINDVAKAILGKMDIYEIAWEIADNIAEFLGAKDCVIYLVDKDEKTLEQIAAYGKKITSDHHIINKIVLPIGKGIVGTVAKTGIAEVVPDTSKDERYVIDDKTRYSEITVPIISDGEVIGIIDSEHFDKNYFTKDHLLTLENIARLVAMQLKNAILLRARQKVETQNRNLLKQLEKSNDELQEYAHIVSHDLKSPLRSINALVSWIKEDNRGKLDEVSLQNFGLIETTLEKMEQLIAGILSFSSIDSDVGKNEAVDLNCIVNDLKGILLVPDHISITILSKLPTIDGDYIKLQQLFQNLIGNAIKFIDKEKGLIAIDVSEHKSYYQFSVKDNGVGIEKKYHDKIFKIFNSLGDSKNSSGIGLSIVRKIVDLYNGEIWIDSQEGEGSTFYFTIKK
ncbi:histidine kinase [Flavobacteriales bacterium 34_180_T64]|nr:histidine kinase [Flavobacteriales bacterium 34_180_T64]